MAAMTGTGISSSVEMARWCTATRSATANAGSLAVPSHLRSAPGQNVEPVAVSTTGRRVAPACCNCSTRLSRNGGTSALWLSGRFRRMTVIPSRVSVEITVGELGGTGARHAQTDDRADPRLAVNFDHAAVLRDDLMSHGQP